MMTTETSVMPAAAAANPDELVLAPSDRFFVCSIPLVADATVASQVELALEEISPFPLAQLYYGHVVAPDRSRALAFAAYRRRFNATETGTWSNTAAVIPSFLALIGLPPREPRYVVHDQGGIVSGLAWDGQASLPVAVTARAVDNGNLEVAVEQVLAELRDRARLPDPEIRRLEGGLTVLRDSNGHVLFSLGGKETARLDAEALAEADVREKTFLLERRQQQARDRIFLRGFGLAIAALVIALLLELAAVGLRAWNERRLTKAEEQAPEVRRVQTAQTLATRIEDLAARRMRPFEMLAAVSGLRPSSAQFTRFASRERSEIEIEAQTPNAADVGAFESALRGHAAIQRVETDLRSREGITTFVMSVTFKPDAWNEAKPAEETQP